MKVPLTVPLVDLVEVVFQEDLFPDGVDVGQMPALVPTRLLRAVERHGTVHGDVPRPVRGPALEVHPPRHVCQGQGLGVREREDRVRQRGNDMLVIGGIIM